MTLGWEPAEGEVAGYEIRRVGRCPEAQPIRPLKMVPRSEYVAWVEPTADSHIYTFPAMGFNICEYDLELAAVNGVGSNATVVAGSQHDI